MSIISTYLCIISSMISSLSSLSIPARKNKLAYLKHMQVQNVERNQHMYVWVIKPCRETCNQKQNPIHLQHGAAGACVVWKGITTITHFDGFVTNMQLWAKSTNCSLFQTSTQHYINIRIYGRTGEYYTKISTVCKQFSNLSTPKSYTSLAF